MVPGLYYRLPSMRLAITYAILALIATISNIGAQDLFLRLYGGPMSVLLSVAFGTGVGLLLKYTLDKRYIFRFRAKNAVHDTQIFALYTFMGVGTTVLFWSIEFGFDHVFRSKEMRFVGGAIGLAIGYFVKYQLDKRFVFGNPGRARDGRRDNSSLPALAPAGEILRSAVHDRD